MPSSTNPGTPSKRPEKVTVSIALPPALRAQLQGQLITLEQHVGKILDVWPQLTPRQRSALLEHSPILARIVALAERLR